jgi:hypothetical protein
MQQGRVQLDADWNEQSAIIGYRSETGTLDIIGGCGGPAGSAGFELIAEGGKVRITPGRYYVDGKLIENEAAVDLLQQPDLPALPGAKPLADPGLYLAYLDVWERHITALDDPSIREVALGGPDTATRTKTIWQVKLWYAGKDATGGCRDAFEGYDALVAPPTGRISARALPSGPDDDPCSIAPGAGFRGLENQLYRVEIHNPGDALNLGNDKPITVSSSRLNDAGLVELTLAKKGSWKAGDAVELFSDASGSDPMSGRLAFVRTVDGTGKIVTLGTGIGDLISAQPLKARAVGATFKWSRDNGSTVTTIEKIDGAAITVHDLGPDSVLGFAPGQWVEITDDLLELNGIAGELALVAGIDPARRIITLQSNARTLAADAGGVDPARHPKLRRWDGAGSIKFNPPAPNEGYAGLEDGVQVRFTTGSYRTGDYWTIPARTATSEESSGNIEWPVDPVSKLPVDRSPFGIRHHYCRIAMVTAASDTKELKIDDCRCLFSPLTRLGGFFYVGGDGQEAMPNDPLPQPLEVGVFNVGMMDNCVPVEGAWVSFATDDGGVLAATKETLASGEKRIFVQTGADGIARAWWRLDPDQKKPSQTVESRLMSIGKSAPKPDQNSTPLPQRVHFHGELSIAGQVAYTPNDCKTLQEADTVQKALDILCRLVGREERGMVVRDLRISKQEQPLRNDSDIALEQLAEGIIIECSDAVDEGTVRHPTCFVTLDLPVAALSAAGAPARSPFAFQPHILDGTLAVQEKLIRWRPAAGTLQWLTQTVMPAIAQLTSESDKPSGRHRALMHLTMKGNLIRSKGDPSLYLDGDAFGMAKEGSLDIDLPSGNRQRGGDFEIWFWLLGREAQQKPLQVQNLSFLSIQNNQAKTVASIDFPSEAKAITLKVANNINAIEVTFNQKAQSAGFVERGKPQSIRIIPSIIVAAPTPVPGDITVKENVARFTNADLKPLPQGNFTLTVVGDEQPNLPAVVAADSGLPLDGDFDNTPGKNFQFGIVMQG